MKGIMNVMLFLGVIFSIDAVVASCNVGNIIVSGKSENPPISWNTNQGLDGLGYTIIEKIFKNKSIVRTRPLPWRRILNMAKNGEIDVVIGVRETKERSEYMTFVTSPIIDVSYNIFYMRNKMINSKEDLKGKLGGYISGTVFDLDFNEYAKKNLTLEGVSSLNQNLKKLKAGRIQYLLSPLLPTIHYIKENKIDIDIAFVINPIVTTHEKFAISNKSDCVDKISTINESLLSLKNNGYVFNQFDRLTKDWDILNYIN